MQLLTTQKNLLFESILRKGLSPYSFELIELKDNPTSINYKNSDYFFRFITYSNGYGGVNYSPGDENFSVVQSVSSFLVAAVLFDTWLDILLREITVEDKWKRLYDEIKSLNVSNTERNDKFTANEYEELKGKMKILKGRINEISLTPDQLHTIESRLDHLTELAIHLNKFDWNNLLIGTIVSIVIELSITQENVKLLWELIKIVFNTPFLHF